MIGFTRSLAREVGGLGVTVNAVAPGFMATEMTQRMDGKHRDNWREEARSADWFAWKTRQARLGICWEKEPGISPARCSLWTPGQQHKKREEDDFDCIRYSANRRG